MQYNDWSCAEPISTSLGAQTTSVMQGFLAVHLAKWRRELVCFQDTRYHLAPFGSYYLQNKSRNISCHPTLYNDFILKIGRAHV